MKNFVKRFLAATLAMGLLFSVVPVQAYQAASQPEVRQSYQTIEAATWDGAIMFVRYNSVHFRATANGTSLGLVHAGDRVRHTGQWQTVGGFDWELVDIQTGQNAGRRGWIRLDMLRF